MLNYSIFHPIIKSTFGFRECSTLIKIAQQTNSYIEIIANNKKGNTNSILSLMQLGIIKDTPIIFTVKGNNQIECVHKIMDLLNEGWKPEDLFVKQMYKKKYKKFNLLPINIQKIHKTNAIRLSNYKYHIA